MNIDNFKPAIVYTIYIGVHTGEGLASADDGGVLQEVFFRFCSGGSAARS